MAQEIIKDDDFSTGQHVATPKNKEELSTDSLVWFGTPGISETVLNSVLDKKYVIGKLYFSQDEVATGLSPGIAALHVSLSGKQMQNLRELFGLKVLEEYSRRGKLSDKNFSNVFSHLDRLHIVVRPYFDESYRKGFEEDKIKESFHPLFDGIEFLYIDD